MLVTFASLLAQVQIRVICQRVPQLLNQPNFLRSANRWMYKMGFRYLQARGTFVDGHDREDVVEYRGMFPESTH